MFFLAALEHQFSIFDFSNNLINWLVLVGLLIWLGLRTLPAVLSQRKQRIESALAEAAAARLQGQDFLKAQEQKLANAEQEADQILVEARQMADKLRAEIEAQAAREMSDLKARLEQEIINHRQQAILQLRTAASKAAIALTTSSLPQALDDKTRQRLLSEFLEQMDTRRN